MRKFLTLVILLGSITGPAFAADEFGERFSNQAPGALADPAEDLLAGNKKNLQDIEPAAGEKTPLASPPEEKKIYSPSANIGNDEIKAPEPVSP